MWHWTKHVTSLCLSSLFLKVSAAWSLCPPDTVAVRLKEYTNWKFLYNWRKQLKFCCFNLNLEETGTQRISSKPRDKVLRILKRPCFYLAWVSYFYFLILLILKMTERKGVIRSQWITSKKLCSADSDRSTTMRLSTSMRWDWERSGDRRTPGTLLEKQKPVPEPSPALKRASTLIFSPFTLLFSLPPSHQKQLQIHSRQ